MVLVNSGFHTRKNVSKNCPQFGHAPWKDFASPAQGWKKFKITWVWRGAKLLPVWCAHMPLARPVSGTLFCIQWQRGFHLSWQVFRVCSQSHQENSGIALQIRLVNYPLTTQFFYIFHSMHCNLILSILLWIYGNCVLLLVNSKKNYSL
jgi:hypothetical protein